MKHYIAMALLINALTACESTAVKAPISAAKNVHALPAQTLSSGECGLFFWTKTTPQNFVFFHKQNQTHAKYFVHGDETSLRLTRGALIPNMSADLDIQYTAPQGKTFHLKGTYSQSIEGGVRVQNGSITAQDNEGWQEIVPVSGIFACQ